MLKNNKKTVKGIAIMLTIIITIIALQFGVSKYLNNNNNGAQLNFYEYRIAPSEIITSPETYTGDDVTVTIATDVETTGLIIQYQLGDNGEWTEYVGPFAVSDNTKINARLVSEKDYFKGPVTNKDINNIAVAKIGDELFKTLAQAIEACPENAGDSQTKIKLLTNVTENVVIPEGKNVVLDLCGNTLTSDMENTITVNGKMNLIDLASGGKLESTVGTAIYVSSTGNLAIRNK